MNAAEKGLPWKGTGAAVTPPIVAHSRPAVVSCIAVEDFSPHPTRGKPDPVVMPGNRGEIAECKEGVTGLRVAADETERNVVGIPIIDPFESPGITIGCVEGVFFPVHPVQVPDPVADSPVRR